MTNIKPGSTAHYMQNRDVLSFILADQNVVPAKDIASLPMDMLKKLYAPQIDHFLDLSNDFYLTFSRVLEAFGEEMKTLDPAIVSRLDLPQYAQGRPNFHRFDFPAAESLRVFSMQTKKFVYNNNYKMLFYWLTEAEQRKSDFPGNNETYRKLAELPPLLRFESIMRRQLKGHGSLKPSDRNNFSIIHAAQAIEWSVLIPSTEFGIKTPVDPALAWIRAVEPYLVLRDTYLSADQGNSFKRRRLIRKRFTSTLRLRSGNGERLKGY
jgi:hypothetical protein